VYAEKPRIPFDHHGPCIIQRVRDQRDTPGRLSRERGAPKRDAAHPLGPGAGLAAAAPAEQ